MAVAAVAVAVAAAMAAAAASRPARLDRAGGGVAVGSRAVPTSAANTICASVALSTELSIPTGLRVGWMAM